jgi:branched-chain amino acid transport system permease protein
MGKAMRAVADSNDLAASTGIDVNRTITAVWFVGGSLVAAGAIAFGLNSQINWLMGQQLLLLVFAAVTLGGLGTDYGAMVGGLLIGVFTFMATLVVAPELKNVGALLVMIVILLVRPQGIFGRAQRIG